MPRLQPGQRQSFATNEHMAKMRALSMARWAAISEEDRFYSKIFKAEGHWLWVGACKPMGYGMFAFRGDKNGIAHRASYIMHKGEIPDGLVVDHKCKVKSCVNPDHLRLVTQQFNSTANSISPLAKYAARTACINGHPYTPDNTRWGTKTHRNGRTSRFRVCIACENLGYMERERLRASRRTKVE